MMQNQAAHGDEQENNLEQENGHGELLLDFLHPVARLIKMRHLRGRNRTMSPEEIHQQDVCIGQLQRLNNATILYCSHLREILVLKVAQELNCLRPDIIVRIPDARDFIQAVQEIKGVTTLPAGIHKQTESHRILHLVPMNVPKPEAVMESVLHRSVGGCNFAEKAIRPNQHLQCSIPKRGTGHYHAMPSHIRGHYTGHRWCTTCYSQSRTLKACCKLISIPGTGRTLVYCLS